MKIQCQSCLEKTATFSVEIHCYDAIQCYVTLNVTTAPKSHKTGKFLFCNTRLLYKRQI